MRRFVTCIAPSLHSIFRRREEFLLITPYLYIELYRHVQHMLLVLVFLFAFSHRALRLEHNFITAIHGNYTLHDCRIEETWQR